ncbi:MAG: hypothetical protein JW892_03545 [Anaerolineae bacterium]|nr:hypothetical protein [Anaerolineae bacterium]
MQHIVVCGDSLYLEGIIEGLGNQITLTVTRVNLRHEEALSRITLLAPDAILVEATAIQGETAFTLLRQGFPIIILDLNDSQITVLKGRRTAANGLADLAQVIHSLGEGNQQRVARAAPMRDAISLTASRI